MKNRKKEIAYITAAYGTNWYQIVKGLVRTFSHSNHSKLIVYSDSRDLDMPNSTIENSLSLKILQEYSKDLPFRSSKPLIRLHAAEKYGNICWIDADMLVYTNLTEKLDLDKINAIEYGYGDNLRECGASLNVPQNNYAMSGFFAAPKEYIIMFEQGCG